MGLIGAHVSIAKGIELSVERAKALDLESFQIFTASQRRWLPGTIGHGSAEAFRRLRGDSGLPFIVHAGYLPNLANPEAGPFQSSILSLAQEMVRCDSIGAPFLVLHPGSHKGSGFEAGLERIATGLGAICDEVARVLPGPIHTTVLFENTAGGPSSMGASFEHIARLIDSSPIRSGMCLDTCHVHAAGHDLARHGGMAELLDRIDSLVGLEKVNSVHINDCRSACGSGADRHADLMDGTLGADPFMTLMNDPRLRSVPMIMETPGGDGSYVRGLRFLRSLRV